MTIDIPDGWAQTTLNWSAPTDTGTAATILAWNVTTYDTFGEVVADISEAFGDNLVPLLDSSFEVVSVDIVDNTFAESVSFARAGTRSGDSTPPNVALLVKKTTALRGKQFRGRNYWPGMLHTGDVDESGTISPSRRADLQMGFQGFFADLQSNGLQAVLLHNDPDTPPTDINRITVEGKVATQRRRLR